MIPVGIAQPIQSWESEQKDLAAEWECKTDAKPLCSEGEGGETGPLRTKGYHQSTSSSSNVEVEEDVQKAMSQMETESSSDSESSIEDGDDDGMEPSQQLDVEPQYGNQTKAAQSFKAKGAAAQIMRSSSTASLPPMPVPSGHTLPPGKKLHVFLSHSTGDQNSVKGNIVVPLRETHHMQVIACYHCMEDKQYNDKHIQQAMGESCVVVVALSPSYLDSQR